MNYTLRLGSYFRSVVCSQRAALTACMSPISPNPNPNPNPALSTNTMYNYCKLYSTSTDVLDIPPRPTPPKCPNSELYSEIFSNCKEEYRLLVRELRRKWKVELKQRSIQVKQIRKEKKLRKEEAQNGKVNRQKDDYEYDLEKFNRALLREHHNYNQQQKKEMAKAKLLDGYQKNREKRLKLIKSIKPDDFVTPENMVVKIETALLSTSKRDQFNTRYIRPTRRLAPGSRFVKSTFKEKQN